VTAPVPDSGDHQGAPPGPEIEEFLGDMSAAEFRRLAHLTVDQIADYLEAVPTIAPLSRVEPGQLAAALPSEAPAQGEPMAEILADVDRMLLPGITH
jgi:aromatic-L-amino-acid decarboxylase